MRARTKSAPVGERRKSWSRNALGLRAGGERGLPGARLCAARLKSLMHFTSRSSLPTHQLFGSRLLEFPDPWIHPCQNPGNILASTATFYIFSRSCIPPHPPTASKPLAHPTIKCWAREPSRPPLHPCGLPDQKPQEEMGVCKLPDLMTGPLSKYKLQMTYWR